MNIEKYLPIAAPAPAGVVIAAQMYAEVYKALGAPTVPVVIFSPSGAVFGAVLFLAFVGAALGCIAMIGGEMLTYKYALIALADGEKKAALLMGALALVCTGLVIWSVYRSDDSRPLISAVAVSVILYVASATRDYLLRRKQNKAQINHAVLADKSHELNIEKERTKQVAAAARLAKAQGGGVQSVSNGHAGQNPPPLDAVTLEAARAYFSANPTHSAREWLKSPDCPVKSPTTASTYKKAVSQ